MEFTGRQIERFELALLENPEWNGLRLVRLDSRAKDTAVKRAMALRDQN